MSPKRVRRPGVTKYRGATIRRTASGRYQADLSWAYDRYRDTFRAEFEARDWVDVTLASLEKGQRPPTLLEVAEAQQARELLPDGVGLVEAARYYVRAHPQRRQAAVTVAEAVEAFLAEQVASGARPKTLNSYRSQICQIAGAFGDRAIDDVTTAELAALLDARSIGPTTRRNYRRDWGIFWTWCIGREYTERNPAAALLAPKADDIVPAILTPAQTGKLLRAVVATEPRLVAYFALAAFAGVRPWELERMDAAAVMDEHVHVGAAEAKSRRQRYTVVEPNLRAWLDRYLQPGPLRPCTKRQFYARLRAVRIEAGIDPWIEDYPRHSFASYHLALYQDAARTALELGHTSTAMLFRHYRNLATQKQARAYFSLRP